MWAAGKNGTRTDPMFHKDEECASFYYRFEQIFLHASQKYNNNVKKCKFFLKDTSIA